LHVAWAQGTRLYHAYSTDGGEDWETPVALSPGNTRSDDPDTVVDSAGNVHIVWEEAIWNLSEEEFYYEIHYTPNQFQSVFQDYYKMEYNVL